jgi:hypothetical protein
MWCRTGFPAFASFIAISAAFASRMVQKYGWGGAGPVSAIAFTITALVTDRSGLAGGSRNLPARGKRRGTSAN